MVDIPLATFWPLLATSGHFLATFEKTKFISLFWFLSWNYILVIMITNFNGCKFWSRKVTRKWPGSDQKVTRKWPGSDQEVTRSISTIKPSVYCKTTPRIFRIEYWCVYGGYIRVHFLATFWPLSGHFLATFEKRQNLFPCFDFCLGITFWLSW